VSDRSNELLGQHEKQVVGCELALEALTAALQTAFEAAVFPEWFEIDEQGPGSRTDALTEALIFQLQELNRKNLSDPDRNSPADGEYVAGLLAVTTIIQRIGASTRARSETIKNKPTDAFINPVS
jgi:hypothetical protein